MTDIGARRRIGVLWVSLVAAACSDQSPEFEVFSTACQRLTAPACVVLGGRPPAGAERYTVEDVRETEVEVRISLSPATATSEDELVLVEVPLTRPLRGRTLVVNGEQIERPGD